MRRAAILVVAVVLVGLAAFWLMPDSKPEGEGWAVHFSVRIPLSDRDHCSTSSLITNGIATGPGTYGGFWTFATRSDAAIVATCYEDLGGTVDVHPTTDEEREQLDYEAKLQAEPCLNAEDKAKCLQELNDQAP